MITILFILSIILNIVLIFIGNYFLNEFRKIKSILNFHKLSTHSLTPNLNASVSADALVSINKILDAIFKLFKYD